MVTQAEIQAALNRGGTVVLPVGTHRFSDLVVPLGATLVGTEGAVLEGSRVLPAALWKVSGDLRWTAYTPLPVNDGHGITFTKGQNLTDPLGKHADQVWTRAAGDTRLRLVTRAKVTRGTFALDAGKLWVHKDDLAAGILVSDKRVAIKSLMGAVRGVAIRRYSPTPADGAAVKMTGGTLQDVVIDACSFASVMVTGTDPTLRRVTVTRAGWMGVAASQATNLLLDGCAFDQVNDRGVFAASPQSGALKTSRCRQVTVLDATVTRTVGQGLWFDQSTSDVTVDGCRIEASSHGVFFEISHGMTLVDSTVTGGADGVKVAGASGVVVVGNTITGGRYAVGIYVDPRSRPGWADPRVPITAEMRAAGVYPSDRRSESWRDSRITWLPRVEVLEHNRLAGAKSDVFVLTSNGGAVRPLATIVPLGYQT